jgi:site-specific DNA-adenine methylase
VGRSRRERESNSCSAKPGEKWHLCEGNKSSKTAGQVARKLDTIPRETYVEPFLGLGNVYRAQKKHSDKEVLNDLDCNRIKGAKHKSCSTKDQKKCELIKKATVTCGKDYRTFLKRYDKPNTLIYLDPPYHSGGTKYKKGELDFPAFVNAVKGVKHASIAVSYSNNPEFKSAICRGSGFTCHKIKSNIFNTHFYELLAVKKQ